MYVQGSLTLSDSTFTSNSAVADGGGIEVAGTLTLDQSTLHGNSAPTAAESLGRAHTPSTAEPSRTTRPGPRAAESTPTVPGPSPVPSSAATSLRPAARSTADTNGTLTVNGAACSPATATDGDAIANVGSLTLADLTFTSNSATAAGGGIDNQSGGTLFGQQLDLDDQCGHRHRRRHRQLGPAHAHGNITGNQAGSGGGIDNESGGGVMVTNSSFTNNAATANGGGIDNSSSVAIGGSTFTGNHAGSGGGIDDESGGTLMVTSTGFTTIAAIANGGGIENAAR